MGSKKHKKHKSERRDRLDVDRQYSLDRPPSLKLILKVSGNGSTPEHGVESPTSYDIQVDNSDFNNDYIEKHKKAKKKKKKKDREKRHKHHKEKKRIRLDSSQEDISMGDDNSQLQENLQRYASLTTEKSLAYLPVSKPMIPFQTNTPEPAEQPSEPEISTDTISNEPSPSMNTPKSSSDYLKSPASDCSGREPRSCVLKMKQSKSPLSKLLDHLLRSLEKKDPHQFFAWPVTDDIAPGYSSIIAEPMDFLSIRQKVDENEYLTMQEFIDDFKLMCENAIKYNHPDTVYHKAAKRLLQVGGRMLQPDQLIRSLRPLIMYMKMLSPKELGFDLSQTENQDTESHVVDSADEGMSTGAEEASTQAEDEKRRNARADPKSRFEAYVDNLTPDEVLAQVQDAAKSAKKRLNAHKNPRRMGFLRQEKDGTTSMKIILDTENICPERVITIADFIGKLHQGTGQLQGFREDRRNNAKMVKQINYGSFCSFAPIFDSRFSNLTKEESELILNTYGDETGTEYASSIMEFSKESCYAMTLANSLLDILTHGEHRKTFDILTENQQQRIDQAQIDENFPTNADADDAKKYDNVQIDFNALRSLSDVGVDISFLNEIEHNYKTMVLHKKLEEQLLNNSTLIERLQQVQNERLSHPLPVHLSHVNHPNTDEIELANQITTNLTEMTKQLPPETIISCQALRKAMGISNVGLEQAAMFKTNVNSILFNNSCNGNKKHNGNVNTTPVPMDLEPETPIPVSSNSTSQVDLENELREFLEGETNLTQTDEVGIEHILMD